MYRLTSFPDEDAGDERFFLLYGKFKNLNNSPSSTPPYIFFSIMYYIRNVS